MSATTYTVVGVMNKMLTVTINVLIWDKHASICGIISLGVCIAGGSLYQQPSLRSALTHPRSTELSCNETKHLFEADDEA